jgi:hypothetical protein
LKTQYRLLSPKVLGIGIPLVAFALYILTSLLLPWAWGGPYCCEVRSFAVAVSNIVYGMPFGTLRPDVVGYFDAHFYDPLGPTLKGLTKAIPLDQPTDFLQLTTDDGNGIGYPLFAIAAFRLFGLHSWAPLCTMLLVMTISATAFLGRFGYRLASIVTLYFATLTAMLFTYIVWHPQYRIQIGESSIRYFSLVAVLPVLHILLHLLEQPASHPGGRWRGHILLGVQAAVLALAILVRASAASVLGAIGVVWLFLVWRRDRLAPLLRDAVLIGVVGVSVIAALIFAMPKEYRTEGRVGTVFWHRLIVSLTVNPTFPFPGLEAMFDDCVTRHEGLHVATGDANASCIWKDYEIKHGLPIDIAPYSRAYEAVLAKQFFKILRAFPREMFDTFVYYKSRLFYSSLQMALTTNFGGDPKLAASPREYHFFPYPISTIALLGVAVAVGGAHLLIGGWMAPLAIGRATGVALWTLPWTLPPYFVAWANPSTMADLTFYCIFSAALVLACLPPMARWAAHRLRVAIWGRA